MMWFVPWNLGEASRVDETDAIHEDDDDEMKIYERTRPDCITTQNLIRRV